MLDQVLGPLFVLWALGLLLVMTRRSVPWVWKLSALFVLLFYVLWFYEPLFGKEPPGVFWRYQAGFLAELPVILSSLIGLIPVYLLLFWPFALWSAYRNRTVDAAVRHLQWLTLVTLCFWLAWLAAYAFAIPLDGGPALTEALRKILPQHIELPELPQPPTGLPEVRGK